VNPISEYLREQAAAHRATAAENPDDPRYGIGVDRVHGALDAARGIRHVFAIGIPSWHALRPHTRAELDAMDGVIVEQGPEAVYGKNAPLIVKNVPAPDERAARARIAEIVGIEIDALGASPSQQRVI